MSDYKKVMYENYVKNHNRNVLGEMDLDKIKLRFKSWKHFYHKLLPADKNAKILDIGCGEGGFIFWLKSLGYNNAMGIDISEEQINSGKKMGITNIFHEDLKTFLEKFEGEFDFISARDVMEHFTKSEIFEILALVRKSLTSNGRFMIQVPNGQGLFYSQIFYGDFTHEVAFTNNSVKQVALNAGFRDAQCFPVTPVPTGVMSTVRHVLWKYKEMQLKFWKMVETGSAKGIFTQNLIAVLNK